MAPEFHVASMERASVCPADVGAYNRSNGHCDCGASSHLTERSDDHCDRGAHSPPIGRSVEALVEN